MHKREEFWGRECLFKLKEIRIPFHSGGENGKERFNCTCLVKGSQMITAGLDVQEVYFTLAPDGEEKNYAEAFKEQDDYFIPKANVSFERHLFWQIGQSSEETVDQFVCWLRQKAASCEFGKQEDEYIRDQLLTNVTRQNWVGNF